MGLLTDKRVWGLLAGLAVVLVLGAGVAVLGLLELLTVLSGGATLLALVQAAIPYIIGLVVLGVVGLFMLVALAAIVVKEASGSVDSATVKRLADRARNSGLLRKAGLTKRL